MGRTANLSPLGLYQWDDTIFDLMQVPEGLDKNTIVDNILSETAELEVLYPNPTVFKNLVGVWSAKQIDVWNRLYATTQYEYNPIENYNRYEEGSEEGTSTTQHSGTDTTTDTETHSGTDTASTSETHGGTDTNSTTETHSGTDRRTIDRDMGGSDRVQGTTNSGHWIAGYDSLPSGQNDGLVKQTRDEGSSDTTTTYGGTEDVADNLTHGESIGKTGSVTHGETVSKSGSMVHGESIGRTGGITHGEKIDGSRENSHLLHAHGNIGVTTTQKLIKEQRQIDLFNLYDIIVEEFKMRFCILVY